MNLTANLCCFALKSVGFEGLDHLTRLVADRFSDQGQKLLRALERANRAAWKSLEVALTGETLWTRLADKAEAKSLRQQIRLFLDRVPLPELTNQQQYRQQCLMDLRAALAKGVLLGELVPAALVERAGPLAASASPQQILLAEKQALGRLAAEVKAAGFPSLGWLLAQPASAGESVVVLAVRFFFRREVERDRQLAAGLQLTAVEDLGASQREAFATLGNAIDGFEERLDAALADAQREILSALGHLQSAVDDHGKRLADVQARMDQILQRLEMLHQPVRARHSLSLNSERERQQVKDLLGSYQQLPAADRAARPEMIAKMGKLLLASGEFRVAEQWFQQAAKVSAGDDERAEAQYNAYRAALEQRRFDEALTELRQAAALRPERFAPFPLEEYEPLRILGAGGFGVTFLCRHAVSRGKVAVKAISAEDLDRDGATVLQEAALLEQVRHDAVIRIRTCGYADRQRRRPYLVMEYFDGPTLEEYVGREGPIPLREALALARILAEALEAAHDRKLLHRDVKPANVLVCRQDGSWDVRLIDFGLAMRQEILQGSISTTRGARTILADSVAGTVDYAAPEQMGKLPGARVGPAADVFGFGRTLTFALFGRPEATYHQYKELPENVAEFLSHCVQQRPEERPRSFGAVLDELVGLRRSSPRVSLVAGLAGPVPEAQSAAKWDRPTRPSEAVETTTPTRVIHAMLALFLGSFGVHKFAQGNTTAGLWRVGLVLTCVGLYVNMFLGWAEGIKYLVVTNEEYDREYRVEKKAWF